MFVWEAHLSTVKDNRSCLTLLLHLECPADLIRVQKLVGGVTWNASCLGTKQLFYCMHRNHGVEFLLGVRLFICLKFLSLEASSVCKFLSVKFACKQ